MLWINGHEFNQGLIGSGVAENMWLDGKLIYQGVRSCYGKGYWRPSKPWLDNEKWKDN